MRTPEGATLGLTAAKVKKIYSDLNLATVKDISRDLVRVPGNAKAAYRFGFRDGVVENISLQRSDQKCYE